MTFAADPVDGVLTLLADSIADMAGNLGPDVAVAETLV